MDTASRQLISTLTYCIFQIPCSLFLLTLIVPLYKLAADRTALYILFSKTCFNIANQLSLSVYEPLHNYAHNLLAPFWFLYPPFGQCLYQIIYVHILGLALNRFVAIFFMFKYKQMFTKKNTFLFILLIWLLGIILGVFVILQGSSGNLNAIVQTTVLIISATIYGAMLVKFGYVFFFKSTANEGIRAAADREKDRILLSCICFLSLLPLLLGQGIRQGLLLTPIGSPLWMCFSLAQILNVTAVQLVEECCLLVFCKDFRLKLKAQFAWIFSWRKVNNGSNDPKVATKMSAPSAHNSNANLNVAPMRIRTITV